MTPSSRQGEVVAAFAADLLRGDRRKKISTTDA